MTKKVRGPMRWHVAKSVISGQWVAWVDWWHPVHFATHAEAIAYADRMARR